MKVLIFEHCRQMKGHRVTYASKVSTAFSDCDVTVALPTDLEGNQQLTPYFNQGEILHFYNFPKSSRNIARALTVLKCLCDAIRELRPDYVLLPTADGVANVVGLLNLLRMNPILRRTRIDICLMKGRISTENVSTLAKLVRDFKWWAITKGPWNRILLIDPRAFDSIPKSKRDPRLVCCPDPVPAQSWFDKQESRTTLGLPVDGRLMVSVGNQDQRKGIDLLLNAFANSRLNENDRLLLLGKISGPVRETIESLNSDLGSRLIVRDAFVSEDEFQHAMIASDIVATPYRSVEQPSGIVSRCIVWGRPIVATNRGWLKWVLDKYDAGWGFDPTSNTAIRDTIETAFEQCDAFSKSVAADEFSKFNSDVNYKTVWRASLPLS